jgi:hypothetical protein
MRCPSVTVRTTERIARAARPTIEDVVRGLPRRLRLLAMTVVVESPRKRTGGMYAAPIGR